MAGVEDGPRAAAIYAGIWAAVVAALGSFRIFSLFSGAFDLGYQVQALAGLWRNGLSGRTAMTGWGFFDDHFAPLSVLLAPLAGTDGAAYYLVTIQAIAAAGSVFLVWRFGMALTNDPRRSLWLMVGYSVAPTLLFALWFDFHPSVLALPFLVLILHGVETASVRDTALGVVGASLAREDVAFLVLLVLLVEWKRLLPMMRGLIVVPVTVALVGVIVIRPGSWFLEMQYGSLADVSALDWPGILIGNLWAGGYVILLLGAWLLPWVFGGLRSDRHLLVLAVFSVPFLVGAVTATKFAVFHYWFAVPILLFRSAARGSLQQSWKVWRWRMAVGCIVALGAGPFGYAYLAPATFTASDVAEVYSRESIEIGRIKRFAACLDTVDLDRTLIDSLVPLARGRGSVRVWPLPFRPYLPHGWSDTALVLAGGPLPELVMAPGEGWSRPMSAIAEELSLDRFGYERIHLFGELAEVWIAPSALDRAGHCLQVADTG